MVRAAILATLFSFACAQTVFPEVTGSNLEGRAFVFPQDFAGELNLVLIAFTQGQQAQVDTWLAYAEDLPQDELGLYEIPVLGRSYRLLRSVIDGGMRSGIADPVARARTVTFYGDKPALMQALSLPDERTVYALLVTPEGEVLWQEEGAYSGAKAEGLEKLLNRAKLPATYDGGL